MSDHQAGQPEVSLTDLLMVIEHHDDENDDGDVDDEDGDDHHNELDLPAGQHHTKEEPAHQGHGHVVLVGSRSR